MTNSCGRAEASAWVGEMPVGEEYLAEQEPDLPAWCNKVPAYLPGAMRYLPTCNKVPAYLPGAIRYLPTPAWGNKVPAFLPGAIRSCLPAWCNKVPAYLPDAIRYLPTCLVQ